MVNWICTEGLKNNALAEVKGRKKVLGFNTALQNQKESLGG